MEFPMQRIKEIMMALEQGTVMMKFYNRRRRPPERRIFTLRLSSFEILQYPFPNKGRAIIEDTSQCLIIIHNISVLTVLLAQPHPLISYILYCLFQLIYEKLKRSVRPLTPTIINVAQMIIK